MYALREKRTYTVAGNAELHFFAVAAARIFAV